ncbi:hypothetical protein NQ314_011831 [Rhamnusium bicolor]|uniref:Peroxiredoxin C-terminal domain-containing protein n=1 Tax=Rhamnusium bicolor TaxID=1586634 RepID=A0AAV8XEU2_9CUCU|nr:hypothetical protein NQ314_011831 [Rhamnusium bicolor]
MPSLRLGDVIPNFSAETTQGPIKFYDWQGDKSKKRTGSPTGHDRPKPQKIVRSTDLQLSMHYPASTGRNVDEILRVIDSLQLVDRIPQIATPANWVPGEKVMILPTVKDDEVKKLFPKGVDKVDMPSGITYVRPTMHYN